MGKEILYVTAYAKYPSGMRHKLYYCEDDGVQ